ncbi:hypothetical protein EC968_000082 [Mortierella alpina]|nr:hypothetical protein EC968_000082 [Mortierella alpina]
MIVAYLVGLFYAIPVTECEGMFAVYRSQKTDFSVPMKPIYLLYPTPKQRDAILIISLAIPIVFGIAPGVASAVLEEQGHLDTAQALCTLLNTVWGITELTWACIVLYYGLKFIFILRAHIMVTEARKNLPLVAFGLADLKGASPARYLLIMLQISTGGAFIALLIGGLNGMIWAWLRGTLTKPENERWTHFIAVVWTCAIVQVYFSKLGLIALHCSCAERERARSLGAGGTSQEPVIVHNHNSNERLTLQLRTNSSWSEASKALERALSAVVRGLRSDTSEASTAVGDARFGTDKSVYEQYSDKRVPPSATMNLSEIAVKTEVSGTAIIASDAPNRVIQQDLQMQEFLRLQSQRQSLVQRMHALRLDHLRQQKGVFKQDFRAIEQHLKDAHQNLERLQAHYRQLQSRQSQSEDGVWWDSAENTQDLHQSSTMSTLQLQLKFTLRQLDAQVEACSQSLRSLS